MNKPEPISYDDIDDDYGDEWACTWCGGDGINEDPNWDEWDGKHYPPCSCCAGTGLRKHQTVF